MFYTTLIINVITVTVTVCMLRTLLKYIFKHIKNQINIGP